MSVALTQSFNQDGSANIGISAAVTTSSPTYTTGTQQALSLTTAGALRVDGSAVTQPISATSLPLPTGASTSALQTTGNTTLSTISTTLTTISGQLPTTIGQHVSAASLSVVIASDQTVPVSLAKSSTSALTSVSASATSVSILAANPSRKAFMVINDPGATAGAIMYMANTSSAATTSAYTTKLFNNGVYYDDLYQGAVTAIWAAANGAAHVTEYT